MYIHDKGKVGKRTNEKPTLPIFFDAAYERCKYLRLLIGEEGGARLLRDEATGTPEESK